MAVAVTAPPLQPATKRKSSAAGLPSSGRPVKRRASKACQCCRSRKVRCDVVESGIPCTNCRLDEVECVVTEGKRRKKSTIDSDLLQHSPIESVETREEIPQFPMFDDIDGLQDLSMPVKHVSAPAQTLSTLEHELSHHKPHMLYQTQGQRLTPEERSRRLSIMSQARMPMGTPGLVHPPYVPQTPVRQDVVLPKYIPSLPNRLLSEDVEYLQKKGAFLIPDTGLMNELLRSYVQFVHPYLPLLELQDFLSAIEKNDGQNPISLLLFQAVMFAATAYIDMRFLNAQGYDSRKAARKAFFQRVKLLYDFDYETDRVTVVQSVLLMTYWYESPDDPKDVWHWLGVAISLARTIGLNCNTSTSPLSVQKQRLWKRIWWCCYARDRLVAIGMRRPIRIREDDFDVPMLELSDFETHALPAELSRMLGGCSAVRDVAKREMLAKMCIAVVRICQCITHVLAAQYSMLGHRLGATQETTMRLVPRKSAADPCEVIKCDRELELWYNTLPQDLRYFAPDSRERNVRNDGEVINLHRALLTGIYLTTSSALHRPQMMPAMPNLVIAPEMKELSKRRVREAASAITDIFSDLYSHDLIRYLPNTGVTILLPAIIIHLLDIKSLDSATRQLSIRRFQFCMQALQKLRDMYASADFAFSFLDAAIRKADVPIYEAAAPLLQDRVDQLNGLTKSTKGITKLTPPPDGYLSVDQINPTVDTAKLSYLPRRMSSDHRNSFSALTPPDSDRSEHAGDGPIAGAAISLTDLDHMHGSPHGSTSHSGYLEADQMYDQDQNMLDPINEEAMKNDFDQLINLEGGGSSMDLLSESLENVDDEHNMFGGNTVEWLQNGPEENAPQLYVKAEQPNLFGSGMVMPVADSDDQVSTIANNYAHDLDKDITMAKENAAALRQEIMGDSN